jgi:hypothetical protein
MLFKMQATDHYMHWLPQSCCYLFIYKCQFIGRELDLKVTGFMFCGVLHMLSNTIQFEHTIVFLSHVKYV